MKLSSLAFARELTFFFFFLSFKGGRGETQDGLWNFSSYDNLVLVSVDNGEGQPPVLALRSCVETRGGSPLQQHLHRYNVFAMFVALLFCCFFGGGL